MSDQPVHEGGCLCGAVRYRISGPIDAVCHCHCSICRRSSGGIVVTWVSVAADRLAVTKGEAAVYRSSEHGERSFCPRCGAQLTFRSSRHPADVDVTLATLDHVEDHPADRHVWTKSRLAWLRLDEHLPGHTESTPGA